MSLVTGLRKLFRSPAKGSIGLETTPAAPKPLAGHHGESTRPRYYIQAKKAKRRAQRAARKQSRS